MSRVVAFVDLGTNSVRLLVTRVGAGRLYTVLAQEKETVRLGEGEFGTGRLQPAAMGRAAAACRRFMEVARDLDAEEVVAVATSATREAGNRDEFLALLQAEAGLTVRAISGEEEARLVHLGTALSGAMGTDECLCIDIGGGSTEISVGDSRVCRRAVSLKLGAIRLSALFPADADGRIPPETYAAMQAHVLKVAGDALAGLRGVGAVRAFGGSGTIEKLAATAGNEKRLAYDDLVATVRRLCQMTLEERRQVAGINRRRADIIVGGAAVLETVMAELRLPALQVSRSGVREGLLADYLAGTGDLPDRRESVLALAGTFETDEGHREAVAGLALALFDSGQNAGLPPLGERERELLECAARLHDVGALVSLQDAHQHSGYIIRHADLPGFTGEEKVLISEIVKGAGKKAPGGKTFQKLCPENALAVRILSALLRIADKFADDGVAAAHFEQGEELVLVVRGREPSCLRADLPAIETWLGRAVRVRSEER